jgi:hypothetical protein
MTKIIIQNISNKPNQRLNYKKKKNKFIILLINK